VDCFYYIIGSKADKNKHELIESSDDEKEKEPEIKRTGNIEEDIDRHFKKIEEEGHKREVTYDEGESILVEYDD